MIKLTIAIPTYNRNEILKENLALLMPQLTDECVLMIIDNCSDTKVADTIADLLSKYPSANVRLERSKTNIGGNANILRCIEYCDTEWLWTLGDDDIPQPDAIKTIFEDIVTYHDATNINYYCTNALHPVRTKVVQSIGVEECVRNIDFYGAMIFISCNIYKVKDVLPKYGYAMLYQSSCSAQFLIILLSLGATGKTIMSNKILVHNDGENTPDKSKGSSLGIAHGLPQVMNFPLPLEVKLVLKQKAVLDAMKNWIRIDTIVYELLWEWKNTGDVAHIKFKYALIKKNYFSHNGNVLFRIRLLVFDCLMLFPAVGFKAMIAYLRLRKRSDKLKVANDIRREI